MYTERLKFMEVRDEQRAVANLPPFIPASMRLLEVLSREDAVVEQVAELMRLDPEFVGEILRLANSPVFGFETQIRSLAQAIVLLGTRRLKALIATITLKKTLAGDGALDGFWRHSVASAFVAAELANGSGVHPDHAYTAALLHDLRTWAALSGCAATDWHVPNGCKDLVGLACRVSDALGFGVEAAQPHEAEDPADLPEPVRSRIDGRVLAALVREKVKVISN